MIVVLKPKAPEEEVSTLVSELKSIGMDVQVNRGVECTVLGVLGNTYEVDASSIELNPFVDRVMRVSEPFKKANRKFHPDNTVIQVGNTTIGGKKLAVIAGPCSVAVSYTHLDVYKRQALSASIGLENNAFAVMRSPKAGSILPSLKYRRTFSLIWAVSFKKETDISFISIKLAPDAP